jgi:hypothetical protein
VVLIASAMMQMSIPTVIPLARFATCAANASSCSVLPAMKLLNLAA